MRKRGNTLTTNLVGLIIAVAFIMILILLISNYLKPGYDVNEEYAKAQLKAIGEKIKSLSTSTGSQTSTIINVPEGHRFFLVYFKDGEKNQFITNKDYMGHNDNDNRIYDIAFKNKNNNLCICSINPTKILEMHDENEGMIEIVTSKIIKTTSYCTECIDINHDIEMNDKDSAIELRNLLSIEIKSGNPYQINEIE
jgi:hypothetical protein